MREIKNIFHLTNSNSRSDEQGKQDKRFERNCCGSGRLPTTAGTLGETLQEGGESSTERETEGVVGVLLWF